MEGEGGAAMHFLVRNIREFPKAKVVYQPLDGVEEGGGGVGT